jgi:hypothetical protein
MNTLGIFIRTGVSYHGSIAADGIAARIDIVPAAGPAALQGAYIVFRDGRLCGKAQGGFDTRGRVCLDVRLCGTRPGEAMQCRLVPERGGFFALVGPDAASA